MIELRPMVLDDLMCVAGWLREPHVATWWLPGTTAGAELDQLRGRVSGVSDQATHMLTVLECEDERGDAPSPIGWCQWYPYEAYPAEAAAVGARARDCGIDYAIGEPTAIGRGLGSRLIATLLNMVRHERPGCEFIVAPDARNLASRRVLERNGFALVEVRSVSSEPTDDPMAIYRLDDPARARRPALP